MLRDYRDSDAESIVRVALAAFAEFEQHYSDWPLFTTNVAKMPQLGKAGEIIAEDEGAIVGASLMSAQGSRGLRSSIRPGRSSAC